MCGISGIIAPSGFAIKENELLAINSCLSHRGPDADGLWISNGRNIGFAHRRLSIIDLSAEANQPMCDKEAKLWIVFNGEIYNFAQIRKELLSEYQFKTNSDTEVVLYAYKKWGITEALSRFRGFFAFALYDTIQNKVFLVRDRFGKKPLFYTTHGNGIAFASEAHAFSKIKNLSIKVDSIYDYLTLGCAAAPSSFFSNVSKVKAGSYLSISLSNFDVSSEVYYDIATKLNNISTTKVHSIEELEAVQSEATRYRMVSDVPVALALSGGLDSSLNAYFCRESKPLCVTFVWDQYNSFAEHHQARLVAKTFGLPYKEIMLNSQDFMTAQKSYVQIQKDIPVGDINTILLYTMSRYLQESGYKVCIVGEGGDEIGGYPTYFNLLRNHKMLRFFPGALSKFLGILSKKFLRLADYDFEDQTLPFHILLGFLEYEKKSFWLKKRGMSYEHIVGLMNEIKNGSSDLDLYFRKITNLEYKLRLPELIMPRIDYPSMAASVEMRSPYMDHVLIETYSSISWDIRMQNNQTKNHFRQIALRYLPNQVLNHPKTGFTHVLTPFLSKTMPNIFLKDVIKKNSPIKEYISVKYLNWVAENLRDENLWRLYSLNAWLEIHS